MKEFDKRISNVDEVKIIKVIQVSSIVGKGTSDDPVKKIIEYYDFNGNILARHDTMEELNTILWKEGGD